MSNYNPFKKRQDSFMVEEKYHRPQLQGRISYKDRALAARVLRGKRMHKAKGSGNTAHTRKRAAGSCRDT